ncbi:MAG: DMT family transporter [Candidatus Endonucleobacter bathymodioli]|uniref:DMT family transporter n=1 Tax=Candidatus Endonucleibacter bathymodioli TaxID=539814 RepID=A0AA90P2P8_9GAMM|nr:DMT family transporter [Candidatus Endonucleobacter bathymodioli]
MKLHKPAIGATWMLIAGIAFAGVNSIGQYLSYILGMPSPSVAFIQYMVAVAILFPWMIKKGLGRLLNTRQPWLHLLRVGFAVLGVQCWLWALSWPVPIWQGIALLMLSPLIATIGSGIFLGEAIGLARLGATVVGFFGAMIIVEPWTEDFSVASLLPVIAAVFWAGYSLMVKYQSRTEDSTTIVLYLLVLIAPFNAILAAPVLDWPNGQQWLFLVAAGFLTGIAQMAVVKAYESADASYVQPFDHAKLLMNVLAGWFFFNQIPPGRLWLGASIIVMASLYIAQKELRFFRRSNSLAKESSNCT